jgi:NAD(P)H-hydrate epimerase
MAEVDRLMIDEVGISLTQMMENAGLQLARLAIDRYQPSSVLVLVGSGGNGGGGLVAARRLSGWGVDVRVALTRPDLDGVPGSQLSIVRALGIPIGEPHGADLILDAVLGYSLSGPARGRAETFIYWANDESIPVLSLDTPSGVDVDTGLAPGAAVVADATLTLALPKVGLLESRYVGELFVADISVPAQLYDRLGIDVPLDLFRTGQIQPVTVGQGR